tara:strand:+ start:714 stop:932 length:219 start_codon:yes stop_codon:yes gene_type:complete
VNLYSPYIIAKLLNIIPLLSIETDEEKVSNKTSNIIVKKIFLKFRTSKYKIIAEHKARKYSKLVFIKPFIRK